LGRLLSVALDRSVGQISDATEDWLKVLDRHLVQVVVLDVVDDAILLDLLKSDERWKTVCESEDIAILTCRLLD
jgi:hypothetical protein